MWATSARMASTGRSVRPTSHQMSAASSNATIGMAIVSDVASTRVLSRTWSSVPAT
jgi:hypothetical protein